MRRGAGAPGAVADLSGCGGNVQRMDGSGRTIEAQWSAIGPELIRLPWDDEVSRRFGERKAQLERAGNRMSDFDLLR